MLRMRHVGRPLAAAIFTFGVASTGRLTRTAPHTAHLYGPPVNRMFVPPQRLRLTGRAYDPPGWRVHGGGRAMSAPGASNEIDDSLSSAGESQRGPPFGAVLGDFTSDSRSRSLAELRDRIDPRRSVERGAVLLSPP